MGGGLVHSLGTAVTAAASAVCCAWSAASARRERTIRRRHEWLLGIERPRRRRRPRPSDAFRTAAREWAMAAAAGIAAAVLIGGMPGCLAGPAVALGLRLWQRRSRGGGGASRTEHVARQVAGELPLAAELLVACLAAGATPGAAADAVGRTLDGPLAQALRRAAAELCLGGDPAQCWSRIRALPHAELLGRWMERAGTTGVPPVAEVSRLAAAYRAERARSASSRARRAAVLATAPLGLCFLPAFLAVGVVPVVIGLAEVMTRAQQI